MATPDRGIEEVKLDGEELQEFIWISPDDALQLKRLGTRKTIENYVQGVKIDIGSEVFLP